MFWDIIKKVGNGMDALNEGINTVDCRFDNVAGTLSSFNAAVNLLVFLAVENSERKKVLDKYVHKVCVYFDKCDNMNLKKIEEHIEWLIESRIHDISRIEDGCNACNAIEWCLIYYASVIYKNNDEYTIDKFTHDLVEFFFIDEPKDNCEYRCIENIVTHLYHYSEHGKDFLTEEMSKRMNDPYYIIGADVIEVPYKDW